MLDVVVGQGMIRAMPSHSPSVEDLEDFWETLQGPLGRALRDAGSIMNQRLQARGQELEDLTDEEILDLLSVAFREAAPIHYQHVDRAKLESALDEMVATMRMEMAANAGSSKALN